MKANEKELDQIRKYLTEHIQMVVATNGEFAWICTVYYVVDNDLNIYFLTSPTTIHSGQIASNPKVAVAIADSPQSPDGKKAGLQMSGICTLLEKESEVRQAIGLWCNKLQVKSPDYSYEGMQSGKISGRMYKIVPKKIKYFNETLAEEGEEKMIEL